MTTHQLAIDNNTLHGDYSRDRDPVLRIQSGDTIESSTIDAGWGIEAPHLDGTDRKKYPAMTEQNKQGHAMTGPVWIEGAQPGKTLVVHFEEMVVGEYGFSVGGGFPHRVNERMGLISGGDEMQIWSLDKETLIGENQFGHRVQLRPFLGNMGMPPPEAGHHSTSPPSNWGGNLDCKDLVKGTRLYLPIPVEGGLFSFGDAHARQGHGEVGVAAIECPMDLVRLKLEVIDDMPLERPRAWTPDGWITFGFDENLEEATMIALDDMLDMMVETYDLSSRKQALGLATAVVDLHVTQVANPLMGVHAFLPHDALLS